MDASAFIEKTATLPIVDVRSPGEFSAGHIPGAINIALFDDDQRAEIGTLYKKGSRQQAILKGLDFAGKKLAAIVEQSIGIAKNGELLIHCWRGGMRSRAFAWAVEQADLQALLLNGGYKAYRNEAHALFEHPIPFVVLTGLTGSGKTDLLGCLKEQGEQVLDLEGLAHHRGSAFGGIGQADQPTVEQFENRLFDELRQFDRNQRIWVEDESKRIGRAIIPDAIHRQMQSTAAIQVNVSSRERARYLAGEYGELPVDQLEESIRRISERLGGVRTKQAIDALRAGDVEHCAEVCLEYYDKTYLHSASRNGRKLTLNVEAARAGDPGVVPELIRAADQLMACEVPH